MSEEIELPRDLVDALNNYIDVWSKTYPILKDVSGGIAFSIVEACM